jgi:hypothetical protein
MLKISSIGDYLGIYRGRGLLIPSDRRLRQTPLRILCFQVTYASWRWQRSPTPTELLSAAR